MGFEFVRARGRTSGEYIVMKLMEQNKKGKQLRCLLLLRISF
jgi:hypothetical protein